MISLFAQSEQNMNAVERVLHYTELPSERDDAEPIEPPVSWPSDGVITFRDVKMVYRENLPLVLKGINFKTAAGEKVNLLYEFYWITVLMKVLGRNSGTDRLW